MNTSTEDKRPSPLLFAALGLVVVIGVICLAIAHSQRPDAALTTAAPPPGPNAQPLMPNPNHPHFIGNNAGMGGGMASGPAGGPGYQGMASSSPGQPGYPSVPQGTPPAAPQAIPAASTSVEMPGSQPSSASSGKLTPRLGAFSQPGQ